MFQRVSVRVSDLQYRAVMFEHGGSWVGSPDSKLFREEFEDQSVNIEEILLEKDPLQLADVEFRLLLVLSELWCMRASLSLFAAPG